MAFFIDCDSPLGMRNGNVPNSDITASSEVSKNKNGVDLSFELNYDT